MKCFVCLIEGRDTAAVCYVKGSSVCRDHVTDAAGADSYSFSHKLRALSEQLQQKRLA